MFGDPATNPKGWPIVSVGDAISAADYGSSTKASDYGAGIPFIRMGNVDYAGYTDLSNLKYVELSPEEVERYCLLEGDILFNRTNSKELVGKTGIWVGSCKAVVASYFIRLRVKREILNPFYLWAFLNTAYMKRVLFETARGAIGQSNINAKELKAFIIGLPPINMQNDFERRCNDLFGIKTQQSAATTKAEATFNALLAERFAV
jgi:type I restriction enzyme S subunit